MRRLLDIIALGLLVVLLLGVVLHLNHERRRDRAMEATRLGVERIQAEIDLARALELRRTGEARELTRIDPSWFDGVVPVNSMLADRDRWMDVAAADERLQLHPRRWWLAESKGREAMFWFNPRQGVVRARVPFVHSLDRTRELYVAVNGVPPTFDRLPPREERLPPTGLETGTRLGQVPAGSEP